MIEILKGSKYKNIINGIVFKTIIVKRIQSVTKYFKIGIYLINLFVFLSLIIVINIYYEWKDFLVYGILTVINTQIILYCGTTITIISFKYFYIVCQYCKLRIMLFNNRVKDILSANDLIVNYKILDAILKEHNSICETIHNYNKFWKKYYFAIVFTLIPFTLLDLQLILFENVFPILVVALVLIFITLSLTLLALNRLISSVFVEILKSYNILYEINIKVGKYLNIKRKLKVRKTKFILKFI